MSSSAAQPRSSAWGRQRTRRSSSSSRAGTRRSSSWVDQLGVHAVAGGEEAVLVEDLGRDRRVVGVRALLDLEPDDRLDQGRQRGGVGEGRLGVHDPHLDRAEARLRAHVPPEEGRLGHRVAADQHVDRLDVLRVVVEGARDADPREGLEERRPRRGEAGVAPLPEGRVDREREQQRQLGAQAVGGVDRLPRRRARRRGRGGRRSARAGPARASSRRRTGSARPPRRRSPARPRRGGCRRSPPASRAVSGCRRARRRSAASSSIAAPIAAVDAGLDLQRRAVRLGGEAGRCGRGGGGAGRESIRWASAQVSWSRSITSSSIPTV